MRPARTPLSHPRRLGVVLLALALLAAQALGLVHRALHGGGQGPASAAPVAAVAAVGFTAPLHVHAEGDACDGAGHGAHEAHDAHGAHDGAHGPWHGHEPGSAECRLVDQHGHTDLWWVALPSAPVVPTATARAAVVAEPVRARPAAAAYLARAPPRA